MKKKKQMAQKEFEKNSRDLAKKLGDEFEEIIENKTKHDEKIRKEAKRFVNGKNTINIRKYQKKLEIR